jgi:pyruvate carboxylase subunit B
MKYVVQVGEERVIVELEADGVHVGDERLRAHLAEVEGTPVRLVAIGDEVHRVLVRRRGERGRYTLWLDGYRYEVEALDERTRAIRDLSAASNVAAGPAPLLAPMPGLVVRVNVEPGAEVRAGQPLVVMEAMKMENELRSPADGTVKSVAARVGQAVEKGALLVELA